MPQVAKRVGSFRSMRKHGFRTKVIDRDTWLQKAACHPLVDSYKHNTIINCYKYYLLCFASYWFTVYVCEIAFSTHNDFLLPFFTHYAVQQIVLFLTHLFSHSFPSLFSLCTSLLCCFLLQTFDLYPDDIDLENEPWFKFFSELEFGRPVSWVRVQQAGML